LSIIFCKAARQDNRGWRLEVALKFAGFSLVDYLNKKF